MPSCFLSALYPKVTVLVNINFAPPSHKTKHIQREGEQIFSFSFLIRLYGYYSVANHRDLSAQVQIFENVGICVDFKDFFILLFVKKEKQNERTYYMNEYEKFFLKSPYIFSKTTHTLYFYKLYKFMKICYNCFQQLFEFHQIIKHFYNKFFVKFTQILFIICPSFLKIFSKIFKIYPNFFQIFIRFFFFFSKLQQILFKTNKFFKFSLYFLDSESFIEI